MGDTGEKTEEATPEKLRKAKDEGQVPKSVDFVSSLNFAMGFLTLCGMLTYITHELIDFTRATLDAAFREPTLATTFKLIGDGWPLVLKLSVPIGVAVFTMGIFANVVQTGFFFAFKVLIPKLDKINPVNGLKGLFKLKKFVELIKNVLKFGIAAWLAWKTMSEALGDMVLSVSLPLFQSVDFGGSLIWDYMIKTIVLFVIIGAADLLYSRHSFSKEMMMSKYDVKQEYKQSEGDPHMKGHRRQLAQELLFSGSVENVRNADAVVVNPAHIAVAIKYDKEKSKAPTIVAKGMRIHAEKIKEIAKHYGVPILRNVPLAQALNKLEIGEEVPEELYEAVAEVLSFVYKIKEEQENRQKRQKDERQAAQDARAHKDESPQAAPQQDGRQLPAGHPGLKDNLLRRKR
jgi:flagellar biosynthetic protein FlhB